MRLGRIVMGIPSTPHGRLIPAILILDRQPRHDLRAGRHRHDHRRIGDFDGVDLFFQRVKPARRVDIGGDFRRVGDPAVRRSFDHDPRRRAIFRLMGKNPARHRWGKTAGRRHARTSCER